VHSTLIELLQIIDSAELPAPQAWHSIAHDLSKKEIKLVIRDILAKKIPNLQEATESELTRISIFLESRLYSSASSFDE
jgi:hypothetical protein